MSRVLMLNLAPDTVAAKCKAADVSISVLESLPSGGTRLVCDSAHGAAVMNEKLKSRLITDPVVRAAYRPSRGAW